jgi:hypothetical protein
MPWMLMEELRCSSTIIDLGTRWDEWSAPRSWRFTPRGIHSIEGRVGPIAGMDSMEKGKTFTSAGIETRLPTP